MAQNNSFARDGVFPSWFANRIQDFISGASPNLRLYISATNTVKVGVAPEVSAGAGNNLVALAINGLWRYITADVAATIGAVSAGRYQVFAVTGPNAINNIPDVYTDHTDYGFTLAIVAFGVTPSGSGVAAYRPLGDVWWDGGKITQIVPCVGYRPKHEAGDMVASARAISTYNPLQRGTVVADGSFVSVSTYPALFGAFGHLHNGGVDPGGGQFRLPDARGRVIAGTGGYGDTGAVGSPGASDGSANGDYARSPLHTHVILSHTHTLPNHVHTVPAHYHGKGTLRVDGGTHAHSVSDPGHSHRPSEGGYFVTYAGSSSVVGGAGGALGADVSTTGAYTGITGTNSSAHSHASSEFSGFAGNTAGSNGDGGFNTSNPTAAADTGATAPAMNRGGPAFLGCTWLVATGD